MAYVYRHIRPHKGTNRHFECHKSISSETVIKAIIKS